jgi:UDP-N-acetylglucosamine--N-acetylmuramyl-(pentapeptide) pyrophosphoryl-undecaprenol N-acetylglucosamine transferase
MQRIAEQLPPQLRHRNHIVDYLHDELPGVLAAADIVVARSGAGTVAELTALGKTCILTPLIPTGGDEQRRTARHLADHGAVRMLAGDEATPANLLAEVLTFLKDPAQRHQLAEAARQHGRPDAADHVVKELLDAARPD